MTDRRGEMPAKLRRVVDHGDYYVSVGSEVRVSEPSCPPFSGRIVDVGEGGDGNYVIETDAGRLEVFVYGGFVRAGHGDDPRGTVVAEYAAGEWTDGEVVVDD